MGGHRQGLQHLWAPPGNDEPLQIPVMDDIGDRRQLNGVSEEVVMVFFNFIGILQLFGDVSGVNSYGKDTIGVRSGIIVASLASPNTDIGVKMSWIRTRFPQGMR